MCMYFIQQQKNAQLISYSFRVRTYRWFQTIVFYKVLLSKTIYSIGVSVLCHHAHMFEYNLYVMYRIALNSKKNCLFSMFNIFANRIIKYNATWKSISLNKLRLLSSILPNVKVFKATYLCVCYIQVIRLLFLPISVASFFWLNMYVCECVCVYTVHIQILFISFWMTVKTCIKVVNRYSSLHLLLFWRHILWNARYRHIHQRPSICFLLIFLFPMSNETYCMRAMLKLLRSPNDCQNASWMEFSALNMLVCLSTVFVFFFFYS